MILRWRAIVLNLPRRDYVFDGSSQATTQFQSHETLISTTYEFPFVAGAKI